MSLDYILSTYGYIALLIGTFLEGETILIAAGFLAHQSYLKLPWVIFFAFLGTLAGDQLYFFLGRVKGMDFIESRPRWQAKSARVFVLLQKHQIPVIIGFRFLYGIRTVTPFIIGAGGVNPGRFIIWSSIGAGTWAIAVGALGYLFGQALEVVLEEAKKYEIWIMALVFLIGFAIWLIHFLKKRTS
ncbi:MAG: DedA family protein [bacterium]|nr:DedA family protein [bacterium]